MGGSQPSTTTQIQKTELPPWVDAGGQENYQMSKDVAAMPTTIYGGQRVAGQSEGEAMALPMLLQGAAGSQSALQTALGSAGQATNYNGAGPINYGGQVADVGARSFLDANINKYMDPNLNDVVNTTLSGMDRNIALGGQAIEDQAKGAGAWGGSRSAVQRAVFDAEGVRNKASTEAGLRSAAFSDAAGRIGQDNASALQAALANQQSGQATAGRVLQASTADAANSNTAAGIRLQGGQLAAQAGQTISDTAGRNSILASQFGAGNRALEQAQLDVNYENAMKADPKVQATEALNTRLAAMGMSPYGKTQTTTTTQPQQQGSGMMTGLGIAASILPLLFSDRDTKKNIKRLGKGPNNLNVYEFDYKDKFGGAGPEKQVGFMSDDVRKKVPSAVVPVKVGGQTVDTVDYMEAIRGPRKTRADKGLKRGPQGPRLSGAGFMARGRAA